MVATIENTLVLSGDDDDGECEVVLPSNLKLMVEGSRTRRTSDHSPGNSR
jgi:hypothetical protein